jgi:2-C-methyl-D-erythritol 4-phosphate cytidylyltransferase
MVSVIILAGGIGKRFGNEIPKQFITVAGKRLIDYSIQTFIQEKKINEVILVVHSDWINVLKKEYPKLKIVVGGDSRKESSYFGLKACNENTQKVLIHDGARPFVSSKIINDCILELENNSAVSTAIPIVDTVVEVDKNIIKSMLNRSKIWAEQTPQGFDYKLILKAHENYHDEVTDDIRLIFEKNIKVKIIGGDANNFKITTQNDLFIAESIVGEKK